MMVDVFDKEYAEKLMNSKKYISCIMYCNKYSQVNDADMMSTLGACYYNIKNTKKALEWYIKAESQENADAQVFFAIHCFNGDCVERNYEKAIEYAYKAHRQGNTGGSFILAKCLQYSVGTKWYMNSIRSEKPIVQFNPANFKVEVAEWCKKAAKHGCADAQFKLGKWYDLGPIVARNPAKAIEWYTKAAKQGHMDAQFKLGKYYDGGLFVEQNHVKAIKWYTKAAEQGNANAQKKLAYCYREGKGVNQNPFKAAKWYAKVENKNYDQALVDVALHYKYSEKADEKEIIKIYDKAAKLGNAKAQRELADCYREGKGVDPNPFKAAKWYAKVENKNYDQALFDVVLHYKYSEKADEKEIIKIYDKAAKLGNTKAQRELADCYIEGNGVDPNPFIAAKWYAKVENKNYDQALVDVALHYKYSEKADEKEIIKIYIKAAKLGNAEAQRELADCYKEGKGVDPNPFKAAKWYYKAAKSGDTEAQKELADCYKEGNGVFKSYTQAVKWYTKSSEAGNFFAQRKLGVCYVNGHGISQDYSKAIELFIKSAESGNIVSLFDLALLYCGKYEISEQDRYRIFDYFKITAQENKYAADVFEILKKYKNTLPKSNNDLAVMHMEMQAECLQKIQEMQAECLQKIQEMQANHSLEIQAVQEAFNKKIDDLSAQLNEHDKKVNEKLDTILQLARKIDSERARLKKELGMQNKAELSDNDKAEIAKKLTDYILENVDISANKPNLSAVEAELKNIFGDTWNKLHSFTKTSLKSARLLWQRCKDMPESADFDYSGICICATAALENELKIHFFDNFQKFLGDPSEAWPKPLLYIGYDKENNTPVYKAKYNKFFSIGSIKYLFNEKDDTSIPDEKDKALMREKRNEYLKTILKKKHSGKTATEHFTTQLFGSKSLVERCEELRGYRNRAAHSGKVTQDEAEICYNEIVGKIEAREHTETINNILICLFEIIK